MIGGPDQAIGQPTGEASATTQNDHRHDAGLPIKAGNRHSVVARSGGNASDMRAVIGALVGDISGASGNIPAGNHARRKVNMCSHAAIHDGNHGRCRTGTHMPRSARVDISAWQAGKPVDDLTSVLKPPALRVVRIVRRRCIAGNATDDIQLSNLNSAARSLETSNQRGCRGARRDGNVLPTIKSKGGGARSITEANRGRARGAPCTDLREHLGQCGIAESIGLRDRHHVVDINTDACTRNEFHHDMVARPSTRAIRGPHPFVRGSNCKRWRCCQHRRRSTHGWRNNHCRGKRGAGEEWVGE